MNNKAHLRPQDFDNNGDIIPMACKEEKGDLISREALKKAFKNKGEGVFKLSRVNDIIDNAPTVELFCSYLSDGEVRQPCVESPCKHERPQGEWVVVGRAAYGYVDIECPCCKYLREDIQADSKPNFCESCGADMRKGGAE